MDFSTAGITYLLLIIPTLFALAVVGQGAVKVSRDEKDGKMILGFGIVFFVLIGVTYFFFIK
ncbi:hypothetical protein HY086_04645 [Candidatus Gottesmanbacteria bacterium]|nr:hypothetical protein [Candidatus Gottesmanbacteria bacterium]